MIDGAGSEWRLSPLQRLQVEFRTFRLV